jgi:hypothetical protein
MPWKASGAGDRETNGVGCQDHISAQVESRNVQGGFKAAIQVA